MSKFILSIALCFFLFHTSCFSQGETAVPFLLITPYAEATGMGEAAVANHTDDPLSFIINPAHMGYLSQNNFHSYGYNYARWLPGFGLSDLWVKTFAFSSGINLKKVKDSYLPVSFGMGYSRIFVNLGTFNRRDEYNNDLGNYHAWESSDQYTLGIGINYWVRAYAGVTFKQIVSMLFEEELLVARAKAIDYGMLIDVPMIDIISGISKNPVQIFPNMKPFFNLSIGIAKNNLGNDEIAYFYSLYDNPLPRNARAGIGFDLGINYKMNKVDLELFSFKWTIEASDVLVKRYPSRYDSLTNRWIPTRWEYQEGFGHIKFVDEVILGKTKKETEKKKGWELNIFDIFSFRNGSFLEDPERGNRHFYTNGFGIRFSGFAKLLRSMNPSFDDSNIIGIFLDHFDMHYNHSVLTTVERNHPLSGTKWDSINIFIHN